MPITLQRYKFSGGIKNYMPKIRKSEAKTKKMVIIYEILRHRKTYQPPQKRTAGIQHFGHPLSVR